MTPDREFENGLGHRPTSDDAANPTHAAQYNTNHLLIEPAGFIHPPPLNNKPTRSPGPHHHT